METSKIRVGLFGVGAIGSVLGCALLKNINLQLHFYNRSPVNAIRVWKDESLNDYPIQCSGIDSEAPILDYLIICLKEHQYQEARSKLKEIIGNDTIVYVFRNGLKLKGSVLGIVPERNVRECIIDCSVQPKINGEYIQYSNPNITVKSFEVATALKELFRQEISISNVLDFHTALWKKVCLSASVGGLLCLVNDTCGIFKNPKMFGKLKSILKESAEVAKKDGAEFEDDFVEETLKEILSYPKNKGSSMLTDMRLGRTIELGAKNGIIQSIAKAYGLATPCNDEVCSFIIALESQK